MRGPVWFFVGLVTHRSMRFVFFCHPPFMHSESMPRFARMVGSAVSDRGYEVRYWAPPDLVHGWLANTRWAKWAGYVDQYLIFPWQVRARLLRQPKDTLYVFCDQALGPWVPLVRHLPHVVHAHDLLALRSALGLIPQNPTSRTGQIYQRYIRRGFQQARHFICVSRRTQEDLVEFGHVKPVSSQVVHNGLNYPYQPVAQQQAIEVLRAAGLPADERGMVLHVGGSSWYKNTAGIIRLYARYARLHAQPLPLWMVSPNNGNEAVAQALSEVPPQGRVMFFKGLDNQALEAAYSLARAFLFPSLAEGFGWPLIEAQACGCPVITTDDTPMNEVAGPHASYLPLLKPTDDGAIWAERGGLLLDALLRAQAEDGAEARRQARIDWASQFTQHRALESYMAVYQRVFALECDTALSPDQQAAARKA
jgi:glycosyltransferase involved in cell wall biosynthesis